MIQSDKQLFDQIYSSQGGIFDIELLDDEELKSHLLGIKYGFNQVIDFLKNFYPKMPYIHFELINKNFINASAVKFNDRHFIGFNLGCYYLFLDMFCKMLATASVLPEIGNSQLENNNKKLLNELGNRLGVFENTIFPYDKERLEFASTCTINAWRFLFFHEICHVIRGHTGLLNSKVDNFIYSEINKGQLLPLPSSTLQTLEMDADSFAINNLFRYHFRDKGLFDKQKSDLKYLGFTVFAVMRIFGFKEFEIGEVKQHSHPPPSARLFLIISNLHRILEFLERDDISNCMKLLLYGCHEAEKAFTNVVTEENNYWGLRYIFDPNNIEITNYSFNIAKNWNNVRPLLEPFAFGALPKLTNL